MNVKSVEKKEKSTVELIIEVSREEFETAIEKVYKKQRGSIAVPGFRKGHAPRKIIEGMYGASVFYEDAINEVYPDAYAKAIEQEKLDAVAYPDVEIAEVGKDGFSFKALVTIRPEVKLGDYKGLTAPKAEVAITDEDIDGEMAPYISRATRLVTVEREAKEGDTAIIDFEGFDNGVPFPGGKGEDHSLELGSHSFVPGFEEQVVGMSTGDEKEINVTFPEDYHAELAGKAVVFKVKVKEIKGKEEPAVDDEFAKDVSEFETLADLRKDLGEKLAKRREEQAKSEFENELMRQVVENMTVEVPDAMVDYRADQMVEDYARRISSQGIPFEQYLQMVGMTPAAFKEQAKEGALAQVQTDLALSAVIEAEKIEATDDEKAAEYQRLADQYSMTVEKIKEVVPEDGIVSDIKHKKAIDLIVDSAKVGAAPAKKAPAKKSAKKDDEAEETTEEKPAAKKRATKKKTEETEA